MAADKPNRRAAARKRRLIEASQALTALEFGPKQRNETAAYTLLALLDLRQLKLAEQAIRTRSSAGRFLVGFFAGWVPWRRGIQKANVMMALVLGVIVLGLLLWAVRTKKYAQALQALAALFGVVCCFIGALDSASGRDGAGIILIAAGLAALLGAALASCSGNLSAKN